MAVYDEQHAANGSESIAERSAGSDSDISRPLKENLWIRIMSLIGWYPSDMPSEEKLVVLKLDLSILIFGCLSFFTK